MKMQGCLDINLSLTIDIESLAEELNGYIGHDEESQKAELPDDTLLCSLDVLPDEGRAEALDEGLLASPDEACLDADVLSACTA